MANDEWKNMATQVAQAGMPMLGTLLGGPLGGVVGQIAGQALGTALGVPASPQAIGEALKTLTPGQQAAVRDIDRSFEPLSEFEQKAIAEVNQSIRQELTVGSVYQRSWRPLAGYVLSALVGSYGSLIVSAGFLGVWMRDAGALDLMSAMLNGVGPWTMLVAPLGAVVGVTAWGRSQEKIATIKP